MTQQLFSEKTASVSDLIKDPLGTVAGGEGLPVAIMNCNEPVFYCIPAQSYAALMERLEDLELNAIANTRSNDGQAIVPVTLDDL